MKMLVDTNVILRFTQKANPSHAVARSALTHVSRLGHELCLVPQSIYEYWVVATRPIAVNGFGMLAGVADRHVQELLQRFTLLRDERGIYSRWHDLVVMHNVQGKQAHDTRLVAAMERHSVKRLLTFNKSDFGRFPTIVAFSPDEIVSGIMPA
ncbi:MAG: PIN domain-containing protein [Planctomycetaceae bacterium]|nr:PIN domain-containing protein [Planctomycetaceae bacterium]